MTDVKISLDEKKEEPIKIEEIKQTLKAVDEYEKLKEQNDRFEGEIKRTEELKQKMMLGGRAWAGQELKEKTEKEKADEEAKKILSQIR